MCEPELRACAGGCAFGTVCREGCCVPSFLESAALSVAQTVVSVSLTACTEEVGCSSGLTCVGGCCVIP